VPGSPATFERLAGFGDGGGCCHGVQRRVPALTWRIGLATVPKMAAADYTLPKAVRPSIAQRFHTCGRAVKTSHVRWKSAIPRSFWAGLLSAVAFGLAASNAEATRGLPNPPGPPIYYCGIVVAPYTDCANQSGGSWVDGDVYYNQAYYNGSGTVWVCQNTYIYGTGNSISRSCGPQSASSGCALDYYYENFYKLSAHMGNDSAYYHTVHGVANQYAVVCS
jgi:hypothetical protein